MPRLGTPPEATKIVNVSKAYGDQSFAAARDILGSANLDILYSPLVGQSPFAQYLAYARLAQVQIADGGRMTTTGMPEIDYYLLANGAFSSDPDQYFSEKLAVVDAYVHYFKVLMEHAKKHEKEAKKKKVKPFSLNQRKT